VNPSKLVDNLDFMARVNYGKPHSIYARSTLDAYDFGDVRRDSMRSLLRDFLETGSRNETISKNDFGSEVEAESRDPYQDGVDDDENSGADDQDRFGH
jgi:hypothetical protein